jgi:hypothetical protein
LSSILTLKSSTSTAASAAVINVLTDMIESTVYQIVDTGTVSCSTNISNAVCYSESYSYSLSSFSSSRATSTSKSLRRRLLHLESTHSPSAKIWNHLGDSAKLKNNDQFPSERHTMSLSYSPTTYALTGTSSPTTYSDDDLSNSASSTSATLSLQIMLRSTVQGIV